MKKKYNNKFIRKIPQQKIMQNKRTGPVDRYSQLQHVHLLITNQLKREKFLALEKSGNNFDERMALSEKVDVNLEWRIEQTKSSFNTIRTKTYKKVIFTDASLSSQKRECEGKNPMVGGIGKNKTYKSTILS